MQYEFQPPEDEIRLDLTGLRASKVPVVGTLLISNYNKAFVQVLENSLGVCVGGGVCKSEDLEEIFSRSETGKEALEAFKQLSSLMSVRDVLAMSAQLQMEWIAFERGLAFSSPMYRSAHVIPWSNLEIGIVRKKRFLSSERVIQVNYVASGTDYSVLVQMNKLAMQSFLDIQSFARRRS